MSTFRGCKAKLTNNLMRLVNGASSNYNTVYKSTAAPEVQVRSLQRRGDDIISTKLNIESALDTFLDRREAILEFIKDQPDAADLTILFEQYWQEHNGDEVEAQAYTIMAALDDLLRKGKELAEYLRLKQHHTSTPNPHNNTFHLNDSPQDNIQHAENHINTFNTLNTIHNTPSPPSSVDAIHVQLRKVELPTFDGDFAMYYDFRAKFKAVVHDNQSLSTAAKFIHLANSLKGSAALVVQGYDITDPTNYPLAVEALRRRYDRPQFTHHFFLQKLEDLPVSSTSASAQRDTLCQVQSCILQLNRFEDTSTWLSLKKLIHKKFPSETQLEVNRMEHRSGKIWKMSEFLVGLDEFIHELEKLDDSTYPSFNTEPPFNNEPSLNTLSPSDRSRSPTPEPYDPRRCCFCGSFNLRSTRCTAPMRAHVRRLVVRNSHLCWKCLRPGHTANTYQHPNCHHRAGNHHTIICHFNTDSRPPYPSPNRRDNNRRRDSWNDYRSPPRRFPSRDSSSDSRTSRRSALPYRRGYTPYAPSSRDRNYRYHSPRRYYSPSPSSRLPRGRNYYSPRRDNSPYHTYGRVSNRRYLRGRNYRSPSTSPTRSVRFRNVPRDSLSPLRRRFHRSTIQNTLDVDEEERHDGYASDSSNTFTLSS